MEWNNIIMQVFEVCIIPMLGFATAYIIKYLQARKTEIKEKTNNDTLNHYIDILTEVVCDCVVATNQTYVEALKDKYIFDEEAQKEAFNRTYNAVLTILSADAKKYLSEAFDDLECFITEKIEAEVNRQKSI